jgi:hypothetical protein
VLKHQRSLLLLKAWRFSVGEKESVLKLGKRSSESLWISSTSVNSIFKVDNGSGVLEGELSLNQTILFCPRGRSVSKLSKITILHSRRAVAHDKFLQKLEGLTTFYLVRVSFLGFFLEARP